MLEPKCRNFYVLKVQAWLVKRISWSIWSEISLIAVLHVTRLHFLKICKESNTFIPEAQVHDPVEKLTKELHSYS